ncbi:exopolysaccharide biosynthesis protein [Frigidibacter oleivorans]|uniref:exopolysaccharide biosynthesis protein n=1 Tax=Frigidibacter oleivorans TaxID=2487129 RepID=UPI0013E01A78|nr:exopolysaccharide biosynthesis protein [Frigidibacter oleivorans]
MDDGQGKDRQAQDRQAQDGDELQGILKDLSGLVEDGDTTLGELVHALESRGYGPLLMALSALMLLPVGMLPGFPALIGGLIGLTALQMLRGRRGVWIPGWLQRIGIPKKRLDGSIDKAWPVVRWLRRGLGRRLTVLTRSRAVLTAVAVLLMAAGAMMVALGFIPGLPFLLALPVLLFGLGLTSGDGLVMAGGFVLSVPPVVLAVQRLL